MNVFTRDITYNINIMDKRIFHKRVRVGNQTVFKNKFQWFLNAEHVEKQNKRKISCTPHPFRVLCI